MVFRTNLNVALLNRVRLRMKYIASCSCGKDSLAMILAILEHKYPLDYVLFFDAGKEFKSIYRNWNKLTALLNT